MSPPNLPNLLSGFRLGSIPVLLGLAWSGWSTAYLGLLMVSLATDFFDGFFARRWNLRTEFGARLDQVADVVLLLSIPVAMAWLWPELLRRNAVFVGVAAGGYAASAGLSWWRFGKICTYHTWLGKAAMMLVTVGALLAMLGWVHAVFRAGLWLILAAIAEEIVITCTLRRGLSDVRSWWHARALR